MKKLAVGVLVICVHSHDKGNEYLVGQSGTILQQLDGFIALLSEKDWIVHFPDMAGRLCPKCGKCHGTDWPMRSDELRPYEDPDQSLENPRVEELPIVEEMAR